MEKIVNRLDIVNLSMEQAFEWQMATTLQLSCINLQSRDRIDGFFSIGMDVEWPYSSIKQNLLNSIDFFIYFAEDSRFTVVKKLQFRRAMKRKIQLNTIIAHKTIKK